MVLEAGALTTGQIPGTAYAGGEGLTKGWQRRGRVASDRRSGMRAARAITQAAELMALRS